MDVQYFNGDSIYLIIYEENKYFCIQHWCIKLIKSVSKDIYNVTKELYLI